MTGAWALNRWLEVEGPLGAKTRHRTLVQADSNGRPARCLKSSMNWSVIFMQALEDSVADRSIWICITRKKISRFLSINWQSRPVISLACLFLHSLLVISRRRFQLAHTAGRILGRALEVLGASVHDRPVSRDMEYLRVVGCRPSPYIFNSVTVGEMLLQRLIMNNELERLPTAYYIHITKREALWASDHAPFAAIHV